jgi:hypothetical protein
MLRLMIRDGPTAVTTGVAALVAGGLKPPVFAATTEHVRVFPMSAVTGT